MSSDLTFAQKAVLLSLTSINVQELDKAIAAVAEGLFGDEPKKNYTFKEGRRKMLMIMTSGALGTTRISRESVLTLMDILLDVYGSSVQRARQLSIELPGSLKPLISLAKKSDEELARRAIDLLEVGGRANKAKFGVSMRLEGGVDALCSVISGESPPGRDLLASALACLALTCDSSEQNAKWAHKKGIIGSVVFMLRKHLASATISEHALSLLTILVVASGGRGAGRAAQVVGMAAGPAALLEVDADVCDLIVQTLRQHSDVSGCAAASLGLIHAMSSDPSVAGQLALDGAFQAAWWVASKHTDRPALLTQALSTLWRLSASASVAAVRAQAAAVGVGGGSDGSSTPGHTAGTTTGLNGFIEQPSICGYTLVHPGILRDGAPKVGLGHVIALADTIPPVPVVHQSYAMSLLSPGMGGTGRPAPLSIVVASASRLAPSLADRAGGLFSPSPRMPLGPPPSTVTLWPMPREFIGFSCTGGDMKEVHAGLPRWAGYALPRPAWYPPLPCSHAGRVLLCSWPSQSAIQAALDLNDVRRRVAARSLGMGIGVKQVAPAAAAAVPIALTDDSRGDGAMPTINVPAPGPPVSVSPASPTSPSSPRNGIGPQPAAAEALAAQTAAGSPPLTVSGSRSPADRCLALAGGKSKMTPKDRTLPTERASTPRLVPAGGFAGGSVRTREFSIRQVRLPISMVGVSVIGKGSSVGKGADLALGGPPHPPHPTSNSPLPLPLPPLVIPNHPVIPTSVPLRNLSDALHHARSLPAMAPASDDSTQSGQGVGARSCVSALIMEGSETAMTTLCESLHTLSRPSTAPASPTRPGAGLRPWQKVNAIAKALSVSTGIGASGSSGASAGTRSIVEKEDGSSGVATVQTQGSTSSGVSQSFTGPNPVSLWDSMRTWLAVPHWFPELQVAAMLLPELAHVPLVLMDREGRKGDSTAPPSSVLLRTAMEEEEPDGVVRLCSAAVQAAAAGQWAHLPTPTMAKRALSTASFGVPSATKPGTTGFLPATKVSSVLGLAPASVESKCAADIERLSLSLMHNLCAGPDPLLPWDSEAVLTRPVPLASEVYLSVTWGGGEEVGGVTPTAASSLRYRDLDRSSTRRGVARVWLTPSGMASVRQFVVPPHALPTAFHCAPPMAYLARHVRMEGAHANAQLTLGLAGSVSLALPSLPSTPPTLSPAQASALSIAHPLAGGYVLHPWPTVEVGGGAAMREAAAAAAGGRAMRVDALEPMLAVSTAYRAGVSARLQLKAICRLGIAAGLLGEKPISSAPARAGVGVSLVYYRHSGMVAAGPGMEGGGGSVLAAMSGLDPMLRLSAGSPQAIVQHSTPPFGRPSCGPPRLLYSTMSPEEIADGPLPPPNPLLGWAVPVRKGQGTAVPPASAYAPDMAAYYDAATLPSLQCVLPEHRVAASCPRPLHGGAESDTEEVGGEDDDSAAGSDEDGGGASPAPSPDRSTKDAASSLEAGAAQAASVGLLAQAGGEGCEGGDVRLTLAALRLHARTMRGMLGTTGVTRREALGLLAEAGDEVAAMEAIRAREGRGRGERRRRRRDLTPVQLAETFSGVTEAPTPIPPATGTVDDNGTDPVPDAQPQPSLPTSVKSRLLSRIPPLAFESRFECGNLCGATRVAPMEYELSLDPDTNTAGHTQWFFFRVRNMVGADGSHVQSVDSVPGVGGPVAREVRVRRLFHASHPTGVVGIPPIPSSHPSSHPSSKVHASPFATPIRSPPSSSPSSPPKGSETSSDIPPAAVYRFHIVNLEKGGSSFNDGMRPLVYFSGVPHAADSAAGSAHPKVVFGPAKGRGGSSRSSRQSRESRMSRPESRHTESSESEAPVVGEEEEAVDVWWSDSEEGDDDTAWQGDWPASAATKYGFGSHATPVYIPTPDSPEACHVPVLPGQGWRRAGVEVVYHRNAYSRSKGKLSPPTMDGEGSDVGLGHVVGKGGAGGVEEAVKLCPQYSQSWAVSFPPGVHTAFFAYCLPYTYSDLRRDMVRMEGRADRVGAGLDVGVCEADHLCASGDVDGLGADGRCMRLAPADDEGVPARSPFAIRIPPTLLCPLGTAFTSKILHRSVLCHTACGNPVPLLTITDFSSGPAAVAVRPYVVLSARVHPGETNGSWMMRGLLDLLTSSCPLAVELRARVIFKVVPMLNPDGVINGHHRTNAAGLDCNRHWSTPDLARAPTIWHLRSLILALQTRAAAAAALLADKVIPLDACPPLVSQTMPPPPPTPGGEPPPSSVSPYVRALAAALAARGPGPTPVSPTGTPTPIPRYMARTLLPPVPQPVILFTDFHGHSRRRDVFMFGCSELAGEGSIPYPGEMPAKGGGGGGGGCTGESMGVGGEEGGGNKDLQAAPAPNPAVSGGGPGVTTRLFPRLLSSRIDSFAYKGCSWKVSKDKHSCARVAMWRDALLNASYTIEASFGGPTGGTRAGTHFSSRTYEEVGYAFGAALLDLLDGPGSARAGVAVGGLLRKRAGAGPQGDAPSSLHPQGEVHSAGGAGRGSAMNNGTTGMRRPGRKGAGKGADPFEVIIYGGGVK